MEDENREYFLPLSDSIQLSIFRSMDFETLLIARLVCFSWNEVISNDILPKRSHLNVQVDKSKICKKFRKGKWMDHILGRWGEIAVHFPEDTSMFKDYKIFGWGQNSSFLPLNQVTKVTLFDCGKASFLAFVHSILAGLPNIHYINIKNQHWPIHAQLIDELTLNYQTHLDSWSEGLKNGTKLTTFRIATFQKKTTIKYLNFLNFVTPLSLVTLDIDFSKNYALPFDAMAIDEIYQVVSLVIQNCAETLKNFRLKWDHRVEGDFQLVEYSRDFDPYVQFLLMISANAEMFHGLSLKRLVLNFPAMALLPISLINDIFVPFLLSQSSTLEKLILSRVRWDPSVKIFLAKFPPKYVEKFELGVFMVDADNLWHTGLKLMKEVSKVEYHALGGSPVFDLNSINARRIRCRRSGSFKWKKHMLTSLRFRSSQMNTTLEFIKIKEILHTFHMLQDLELIDNSSYTYNGAKTIRPFSHSELNRIFLSLPRLRSLKITNLEQITDAGLTLLSQQQVCRMQDVGVFFPVPPLYSIPMAQAKNLMYLELRDLPFTVTDLSVFLAFQFIPKLEKVAFHGSHKITDWGKSVLLKRFKRNPRFEIFINSTKDKYLSYLVDFP